MANGTTPANPLAIVRPTAIIYGPAIAARHGAMPVTEFFDKLTTDDKLVAVIPRGGHYLHLHRVRFRLYRLVTEWFRLTDAV